MAAERGDSLNGDRSKQGERGSGRGAHSELGGTVEEAGGRPKRWKSTTTVGDVRDEDDDDGVCTGHSGLSWCPGRTKLTAEDLLDSFSCDGYGGGHDNSDDKHGHRMSL